MAPLLLVLPLLALPVVPRGVAGAPALQDAVEPSGTEDPLAAITLPEGPYATLLGRLVAASSDPQPDGLAGLATAWPAWNDRGPGGWSSPAPWNAWVEILRREARGGAPLADRARLVVLAVQQRRHQAAWQHLARLAAGSEPEALATARQLLPLLWPGIPLEHLGRTEPLPEGVLLAPALPPTPGDARRARFELPGLRMDHGALRIGASVLALRLMMEPDGVQLDVEHRAGPPVRLRVRVPEPPDLRTGVLYADWEQQADPRATVALETRPDGDAFVLWARLDEDPLRWPAVGTGPVPRVAPEERAPLVLAVDAAALGDPFLERLAEALGRLFGRSCILSAEPCPLPDAVLEPLVLHLDPPGGDEKRLAGLLSLLEARALAGSAPR